MRKAKKISFFIFWFVFISIIAAVSSQQCIDPAVFDANSNYGTNLQNSLSYLPSNVTTQKGFYNASIGQDAHKVYAMGMCITENEPKVCSDCIRSASDEIIQNCPNKTEAYTWRSAHNELCFARVSKRSFFGTFNQERDMHPFYMEHNSEGIKTNLTEGEFGKKWDALINRLVTVAATENGKTLSNRRYYATDEQVFTNFLTIYALMQCTPDLQPFECSACLGEGVNVYRNSSSHGTRGGIIAWPKCFFRWDMQPFSGAFDHGVPCSKKISTKTFVLAVAPIVVISFILYAVVVVLVFRRSKSNPPPDSPNDIPATYSLQYDLKTIQEATCSFSKSNILGTGGYGEVFKGLLQDGSAIAAKRLSKESAQGVQEFKNETSLVAKLQHKNLVGVLGFCMEGEEKILIYEFVPNKSLDHFLFDPTKQGELDWAKRYKIIVGTAKGIQYLHHDSPLTIIHRDLKASNILLDAEMKPKVADFGMARILEIDQSRANTRRVVGTHGYIAPEYMMHGQFSMKSDVYGFGVLVLEIISGKRNSNFHENDNSSGKNLVMHAWKHWRNGSPLVLVDAEMGTNYQSSEIIRCIHIALLCVQNVPEKRPYISGIISMLTSDSTSLPVPESPVYRGSDMGLPTITSVPVSTNDSLINDLVPR